MAVNMSNSAFAQLYVSIIADEHGFGKCWMNVRFHENVRCRENCTDHSKPLMMRSHFGVRCQWEQSETDENHVKSAFSLLARKEQRAFIGLRGSLCSIRTILSYCRMCKQRKRHALCNIIYDSGAHRTSRYTVWPNAQECTNEKPKKKWKIIFSLIDIVCDSWRAAIYARSLIRVRFGCFGSRGALAMTTNALDARRVAPIHWAEKGIKASTTLTRGTGVWERQEEAERRCELKLMAKLNILYKLMQ